MTKGGSGGVTPLILSPTSLGRKGVVGFEPVKAFSNDPHHASNNKASSAPATSSPVGMEGSNEEGGKLLPRKSFLLKDLMATQPTAYRPKYIADKKAQPPERWIRRGSSTKWKPVPNENAIVPSLLVPGYTAPRPNMSWDDVETDSDDDHASSHPLTSERRELPLAAIHPTHTSLKYFASGEHSIDAAQLCPQPRHGPQGSSVFLKKGLGRQSITPSPGPTVSPRAKLATSPLRAGTPLENGVQVAWCSSYVQLGPFRDLVVYRHPPPGQSVDGVPVEVVPPSNLRLTPMERHRVKHAQSEYTRHRATTTHHGHVSSDIARTTHIGLPTCKTRPPSQSRSGTPAATSSSLGGTMSATHTSPSIASRSTNGNFAPLHHPAMHFSLPPTPVLQLPEPINAPSQLPERILPTLKYTGKCAHRTSHLDDSDDGCPLCADVVGELTAFDNVREAKEERLYQHQLELWREEQAREEDSKNVAPDMMRTKSGRLVKRLVILDEGPTIAQLYHGTTHEDREALYVATVGGLSFDISKERFAHMVQKVLAPRIHVRVSDDQVTAMFIHFDADGNGTVSYLEYLSTLTMQLLTTDQRKFLDAVFDQLYRMPNYAAGADAKAASRALQQHQELLQFEGGNTSTQETSEVHSMQTSLTRRKSSVHQLLRRKSSMRGGGEDALGNSILSSTPMKKKPDRPQVYLNKNHITVDRVKRIVYDQKQHNPWFPHPHDDEFAEAVCDNFKGLHDDDRVNLPKFRMFIFCDDRSMVALELLYPKE